MFLQVAKNSSLCWASRLTARLPSTKCQSPFTTVSVSALCSTQECFLSHSPCIQILIFLCCLLTVSNVKNVDPGKFPMHYCYCLNNVTNDLTGGYTREVGNCECLSWIISFGAGSCSLNSADFTRRSSIAIPRSTAITTSGCSEPWGRLDEPSLRRLHPANRSGMDPSVKWPAWSTWQKELPFFFGA